MEMEIAWSDSLATGIRLIDTQHKKIVKRIARLFDATDTKRIYLEVRQMLEFLEEYTDAHFGLEEKYMADYAYPEAGFHKEQHEEFRGKMQKLFNMDAESLKSLKTAAYLQHELQVYFSEHIGIIDSALGRFLVKKGVQ